MHMLLKRKPKAKQDSGSAKDEQTTPKISKTSKGGRVVFDVEEFANDDRVQAHFKKAAEWVKRQRELDERERIASQEPAEKKRG